MTRIEQRLKVQESRKPLQHEIMEKLDGQMAYPEIVAMFPGRTGKQIQAALWVLCNAGKARRCGEVRLDRRTTVGLYERVPEMDGTLLEKCWIGLRESDPMPART